MMALIMSLFKSKSVIKESNNKRDIIYFSDFYNLKIIFIMLIKLIAIYIKFFK